MTKYLTICLLLLIAPCAGALPGGALAEEAFRTDGGDESLPWYQIQAGVFPPAGSGHYFSGELIQVDHLNRKFVLRVDRTDAQNRSHWDLPVEVTMLPYGSIYYHGAPAALEDIPLGTHLHGLFYAKDTDSKIEPLAGWHGRISYEAEFTRCLQLEDDFSHHARARQAWRIDDVNESEMKLTATLLDGDIPVGSARQFDLLASTRVWQQRGIATLKDLAPGQIVQFNLTWATLYGPGRIREIWLDEQSRQLASEHQTERHRLHIRNRGLAGWIDEVDNQKRHVAITLFGGVDPELLAELRSAGSAAMVVAEENLLTYDPVNDRKSGPVLEVKEAPDQLGSSGLRITVRPDLLLEGFRPRRIVRVYPSNWPVIALPMEEQLFGR